MGFMRKSLHIATIGAVAPNSKKQRTQRQILTAVQGGTPAQVRRAGGRYEHSLGSLFGGSSQARPAVLSTRLAKVSRVVPPAVPMNAAAQAKCDALAVQVRAAKS